MREEIFYPLSVPSIRGNEWQYVKECLDTEWVSTAGSFVDRLETDFAQCVGAKFAVACNSGTAALQVALQCAGVAPGDEVILPTVTFIATANTVTYLSAEPVFVDCDSYYNINIDSLEAFLGQHTRRRNGDTWNKQSNRRISAIVPVHVFGNAVDMERLMTISDAYGITIVEDAAESLGTRYTAGRFDGQHTGTIGALGCFSFNGNKIVTTGGGGMIVTNDDHLATRARHLTTTAKQDEVRYLHDEIGYNFRLTNVQAAIGVAQLELLAEFLEAKARNHAAYASHLKAIDGLALAPVPAYATNNLWMCPVRIDARTFGRDREQLMQSLSKRRVQTRPLWQLNHLQAPFAHCQHMDSPVATQLLADTLCFPCSTNLTECDIEEIVNRIQ